MENFSENYEPLELFPNQKYVVIDALYINDIRNELGSLDRSDFLNDIRKKVFPHTRVPFAEFIPIHSQLKIDDIQDVDYQSIIGIDKSVFSMDTSLLVFVNEKIFIDFVSEFDYDCLVDSDVDLINYSCWESVTGKYDVKYTALVLGGGLGAKCKYEFIGGGMYRIVQQQYC